MTEFEAAVLAELTCIRELLERREAGETNLLRVIRDHVYDLAFTASRDARESAGESRTPRGARARGFAVPKPAPDRQVLGIDHG